MVFIVVNIRCIKICNIYQKRMYRDFPGGPVAKILGAPMQGVQVLSLIGELKSHMLRQKDKKRN